MGQFGNAGFDSTPSSNWAGGHEPKRGSLVAPMIAGAALFAAGCGGGLFLGWTGAVMSGQSSSFEDFDFDPAPATMTLSAPETVTVGEPFDLVITITETGNAPLTLATIDFETTLTQAFEVVNIDPPTRHIEPVDEADYSYTEYIFNRQLPALGSQMYTFRLRALSSDNVSTEISAYFDDSVMPLYERLNINIVDADETSPE